MTSRRHFIQLGAATIASSSSASAADGPIPAPPVSQPTVASRIIDTHTHFYDPTRPEGVPWPSKGSKLDRAVYPRDWLAVAGPLGVRETVVVEASKWLEDNAWILDLAAKERSIIGFVGHIEPDDVDFAKHLRRFAANSLFRGIRVSGAALDAQGGKPEFIAAMKLLAGLGLELDVNGVRDLSHLAALATAVPDLRIVINHVGSAGDPRELTELWRAGMKACGAQPQIFCKVSALAEQSKAEWGKAPTDAAFYAPILDHVWQCFGEDRLIYASNWPVSEKGSSYAGCFNIVSDYFTAKGREASEKFFWKNAARAYACGV
jgi:L-fuconolactonase